MNRIDRLTAIITYLQGRNFTSVDELSGRYGITPRTVYRDLSALQEAGVPLGSEPGKGYFIVKGYHLPPVMFNREEAASLLTAGRLMQKWDHTELGRAYSNALNKIRAILPPSDKEYLETLEQHIAPFPQTNSHQPRPDLRFFNMLQNAVIKQVIVELVYHSPYGKGKTTRRIEPLGLLVMGDYWYLAGWCQIRNDYRTFRLDRMESCALTKKTCSSNHTLKEYYERHLHRENEIEEVVVRFEREVMRFMGDQKYWYGWAWEKSVPDGVEVTFLCNQCEYICRWLLTWGDSATVIRPHRIQEKMYDLARELSRHHNTERP
ncbi:YafY family protein [Balneolales bacterium ANBcel1]|nr:YafY family protein [Balneolales bacterium ANBcel1]